MPTYGTSRRDTTGLGLVTVAGTTGSDNDVLTAVDDAITATSTANAAAAATARELGLSNNTPQALIQVVPGVWSWDVALGIWHERFNTNDIYMYWGIPTQLSDVIVTVKDVADAVNGRMTIRVTTAPLFVPPSAKTYTLRGIANSAGSGNVQQIILPITWAGTGPAEMRVQITTGNIDGGALIADQYQVQQLRWTVA